MEKKNKNRRETPAGRRFSRTMISSASNIELLDGSDTEDSKILKWNLPLKELFRMACSFYKGELGDVW